MGYSVLKCNDGGVQLRDSGVWHEAVPPESHHSPTRLFRWHSYAVKVRTLVTRYSVSDIYIEAYSYSAKGSAVHMLVELGTVIRLELVHLNRSWVEIPPSSLKKFMTGKGNADKKAMVSAVRDTFAPGCTDHNEADAIALSYLGAYHTRALVDGKAAYMEEALASIDKSKT